MQRMLAVSITLPPGYRNEFIDCPNAKVRIAVPPMMELETWWNPTLELLQRAYRSWEFTRQWLKNPKYSDYQPLCTTQDEWTIVRYVMKVWRPFRYSTLWTSQWHTVTPPHIIAVYNDMLDNMEGDLRTLAKKMTQWKEDLYFSMKFVWQKLSKYYAEVTARTGMIPISAHILDSFWKLQSFRKWDKAKDIHPEDQNCILPNTKRPFSSMWRTNTLRNINKYLPLYLKLFRASKFSPLQRLGDLVNRLLVHMICAAMRKITSRLKA